MLRDQFERAAGENLGQLLLKAARRLDETALRRLRDVPGVPAIRPAHTKLFPHISHEGIRSTEIAQRLGVTKQAVAPLVADLVAWGMVEQVPDPRDGRARLVRWTEEGLRGLMHGLGVLEQFEVELAARIGPEKTGAFREALIELLEMLDG